MATGSEAKGLNLRSVLAVLRTWMDERCRPSQTLMTQSGGRQPTFVASRNCYSITSSAVANNVSGMVRPSAFAVLPLITSSNLVGA